MDSGFPKKAPRGKPFQKGDVRIQPKQKQDPEFKATKRDLRKLANELAEKTYKTPQGEISGWDMLLTGMLFSASKGNPQAGAMFLTIAGKSKYLQQEQDDSNQQGTATIGLFNAPEHKTDFITDVEEI
jgi:hypothetical protein